MVSAKPEIQNRGGVKCQLCNAFKLRYSYNLNTGHLITGTVHIVVCFALW